MLPIYLSTYLPVYLSTYLPIYLSTCLSTIACGRTTILEDDGEIATTANGDGAYLEEAGSLAAAVDELH